VLDPVILAQILRTGIATSSPYVLMTIGFALTLKVTGLWNFAHAGLMAIAFYVMFFVLNVLALPVALALALAAVVTGTASLAIESYGLQVLRDRGSGNLTFFIFTLILSEFIIYVITLLFGTEPETLFKSILSPARIIGNVAVSGWNILAISVAASGLVSLYAFLTWTREGQFLGAVADNARLAELYGISARRARRVVSVIAALFIVADMYLIGTHGGVVANSPLELILTAVIGTLLGGIGRVFAGAAAAVFLGLIQSFSILVIGSR
jgi:branched-subunit amino acid ABC-type transport system permease component